MIRSHMFFMLLSLSTLVSVAVYAGTLSTFTSSEMVPASSLSVSATSISAADAAFSCGPGQPILEGTNGYYCQ